MSQGLSMSSLCLSLKLRVFPGWFTTYVSREQKRSNLQGLCLRVLFLLLLSRQHVTGGRMGLCHDATPFILYLDLNLHPISHGLK